MVKNALYVLSDDHLPQFKANALDRAKQFELSAILPMYEAHYERVLQAYDESVSVDQVIS